jgi:hypothetical protein
MIQDTATVSLFDGTAAPAMEVYPGGQLLSFTPTKAPTRARVLEKTVANYTDAVCLLLGNGCKFMGSRDQKVAVFTDKQVRFKELADIMIGDRLRGEKAGVPIIVTVIGLSFDLNRQIRLVGFKLDHNKNFVAEGILCRA